MKAIHTELEIGAVTINKDDSVSFRAKTPELTDKDLAAFRKVAKVLVNAVIEPQDGSTGVLHIKEKIGDGKSPSQRLRASIYVWWEQTKQTDDFEVFYRSTMEKFINHIQNKLT